MTKLDYFDSEFKSKNFTVKVSSLVNNSESEFKIRNSLTNLFPQLKFNKKANQLEGISDNISTLFHLCLLINKQKILDAARNYIVSDIKDKVKQNHDVNEIVLFLNKQIAFYEKISFCFENDSPLGPIILRITLDPEDLDKFVDIFFPKFEWISN